MKKEEPQVKKFEEGVAELEALVRKLESGELRLEDALSAFEQGIGLVRNLTERLNEAEARIEVLTRSAGGVLGTEPLAVEEDEL
jgi:exodeoxyribonuclease VII small subunit